MNKPNFSLEGKVALVTGGKRGIGKAIALAYAEYGADVIVSTRNVEDGLLAGVAEEIKKLGRRSMAIQADVSKSADVFAMVDKVIAEFGRIDILVNNAGLSHRGMLVELPEAEWDALMNVDLKGFFLCSQAVGRTMVQRKSGNIINISSGMGTKAMAGRGAYCIAKAGVLMLTRSLAQDLASSGIRSNAIAPGLIKTDFSREGWTNPEYAKRSISQIPMGRMGEVEDLTGVAVFLASDASSFITGATIMVDGGKYA
jgi:NAD(P)-dependent dehydrogenase (short-subunit alcohol dehydrogenase family)